MATYTINTELGQTIFDIAIQEYGDPSMVFLLFEDNPILVDINHDLVPGTTLVIQEDPQVNEPELMNYFRENQQQINCGE